nr:MAG TPA: hypothetical protein [Caudoviricetes sp.]
MRTMGKLPFCVPYSILFPCQSWSTEIQSHRKSQKQYGLALTDHAWSSKQSMEQGMVR